MHKARTLRRNQTDAEKKLWYALRDRRLKNWKFRRQAPIGPYIADFVCFEAKLVIEVDGGQHADNSDDETRTNWLEEEGLMVLRFWNNEVLGNTEGVLQKLCEFLNSGPPHPARALRSPPSPTRGEGQLASKSDKS